MFAKYWEPTKVKTRLAATIGDQAACHIYRKFIEILLRRLEHTADRRTLAFWPPERHQEFSAIASTSWKSRAQAEGNLGTKMMHYFRQAFATGGERVVIIGSDSPTLPLEYVEQAFDLLQQFSVVLGPTSDGGYYLVGASQIVPPIFANIHWSSSSVWQDTLTQVEAAGLSYAELPPWYDVDDYDDLLRLYHDLVSLSEEKNLWQPLLQSVQANL